MSPPGILPGIVGVAICGLMPFVAALVAFVMGGCRMGRLGRDVEIVLRSAELFQFQERLHARLAELGFSAQPDGRTYVREADKRILGAEESTHTSKKKYVMVDVDASRPEETRIKLHAEYAELIVADTGEGAYLDAMLEYLLGTRGEIKLAPAPTILSMTTLVCGLVLLAGGCLLTFEQEQKWWLTIVIVGSCNVMTGIRAMMIIHQSRGQFTGWWGASIGMAIGLIGTVIALAPVVKAEILKFFQQ